MLRITNIAHWILIVLVAVGVLWASSRIGKRSGSVDADTVSQSDVIRATIVSQEAPVNESARATGSKTFPVTVRRPEGPPLIELAGADPLGRSGKVACSTCHSVRPPNYENRTAATLDEFHQGLQVDHGKIACYACHHATETDSLRLADGTAVQYQDVMTMCSQCHGPQATAFAHGAHGGMNGYWDLTRGPQTKNNCVDCHDPHLPSYPKMIVDFKPRDRFLDQEIEHDGHE